MLTRREREREREAHGGLPLGIQMGEKRRREKDVRKPKGRDKRRVLPPRARKGGYAVKRRHLQKKV